MAKIVDRRSYSMGGNTKRSVSKIKYIVRHCSATESGSAKAYENYWGGTLGWKTGGYHEHIKRDGTVEINYSPNVLSNGVKGKNTETYHICLAGIDSFTDAQEKAFMERVLYNMKRLNVSADNVWGHREFPGVNKACPGINMKTVRTAIKKKTPVGGSTKVSGASTSSSSSDLTNKTLRKGNKGSAVKALQEFLMEAGYKLPEYGADSDFGDETEKAVNQLKKDLKLTVDGTVTSTVRRFLRIFNNEEVMKKGDDGSSVKAVQYILEELGYELKEYGVDGDYGNETANAVEAYQKDLDMKVDGVVGPNTLKALAKRKKKQEDKPLYRVRKTWDDAKTQIGAYSTLSSAKEVADENKGTNVYNEKGDKVYPKEELFRVRKTWKDNKSQLGAFSTLENAKELADKNKGFNVYDADGKKVYEGKEEKKEEPKEEPKKDKEKEEPKEEKKESSNSDLHPIMGDTEATVEQMVAFAKEGGAKVDNLDVIAKAFLEKGKAYGVRGDIAFAQSVLETGFFKYEGSAVSHDQHNFCGLGVTERGKKGHSFDSVEQGVTAQLQHLYAYATEKDLPKGEKIVDPRFDLVKRGSAPTWEQLSNKWAMNDDYGTHILDLYKGMAEKEELPDEDNELWDWIEEQQLFAGRDSENSKEIAEALRKLNNAMNKKK